MVLSVAGTTQEAAIVVPLSVTQDQLVGALEPTATSGARRWFVVTLPANEKRALSVSVDYKGTARNVDFELIDPAGQVLLHTQSGARSARLDEARGTYFIRVTTHVAVDYVLGVNATRSKDWEPCNPFEYDAANPRCRGVVACDPNKPENSSCCSVRCAGGECAGNITRADEGYAWFSLGANAGVTTRYHGTANIALQGGTSASVSIRVVKVESTRSKILLDEYSALDLSRLNGSPARLHPSGCND